MAGVSDPKAKNECFAYVFRHCEGCDVYVVPMSKLPEEKMLQWMSNTGEGLKPRSDMEGFDYYSERMQPLRDSWEASGYQLEPGQTLNGLNCTMVIYDYDDD